jgi:hypothetical protein
MGVRHYSQRMMVGLLKQRARYLPERPMGNTPPVGEIFAINVVPKTKVVEKIVNVAPVETTPNL